MDFLNPLITPIVETLIVPVKKHLRFWLSSPKYVKDLDAEMKRLEEMEEEVEDEWGRALANSEVVPKSVEPWLKDVKELKDKKNDIPTGAIGCYNVFKRHGVGERSFNFLQEISRLKKRGSKIVFTKVKLSLAEVRSTSTQSSTCAPVLKATQNNFKSRELVYNQALKSLDPKNDSCKIIALCGIGGIGKTTMMEQLEKDVRDSSTFKWVVKVHVGQNRNLNSLQKAISEYISEDLTEEDKDARADRLRKKFDGMSQKGENKVLIIMDDLWKEVELKDVGLTSPLPNGFKLLLTSRLATVCTTMGADSLFDVDFLNEAEAKDLFFEVIGSNGVDHNLRKIGEEIVMQCRGFPIAIKTIAQKLRGAIKEEWEFTLSRLEKSNLKDLEKITETIFQMSYDNVKDDVGKAIFLLSGLFPSDFNIPTEDLLRYGWGLNFFKDIKTLEKARSQMKISVTNLIRTNLLTKSDVNGCVRMHDLVRAFVLSNFSEVKQALIGNMLEDGLTKDATESYDRISLKCRGLSEFPADFNHPNLSLLTLRDGNELCKFPEDMYRKMEKLKVASFENMHIPLFPVPFEHSTKLRTLCLHSCSFIDDDLLFLGNLSNLETLSFAYCNLKKLPSTIAKLTKLKLLDVTGCDDLCIDDDVFQNMESLEELYMKASVRFTSANCVRFEELLARLSALELEFLEEKAQPEKVSFEKLKRFKISIGGHLNDDEKYPSGNTLEFVVGLNKLLEYKISTLLKEVEILKLQVNDMYLLNDISMDQSFSNLRVLYVSNCAHLTCLFTTAMANELTELERLSVSDCPVLTSLVDEDSRFGDISFQKLKFMSLEGLPNMVSLCENVIELPKVVELRLVGLPKFISIFPDDNNTSEMQPLLDKKVVIHNLEKLEISKMENLKQVWPGQISTIEKHKASLLRQIIVSDCDSLVNLFPSNPLPFMNHLLELEVSNCRSIEVLFNINFDGVSGMGEDNVSSLRRIKVHHLGNLKEFWRMRGVHDSNIRFNGFKNVEIIGMSRCKRFTNLFTPITTNFDLGALTHYITFKNLRPYVEESDEEEESAEEEINSISEGERLEVGDYYNHVKCPSYFLCKCHHLQLLQLEYNERVEVVFEMDSQRLVLLPSLQYLRLKMLKEMSHVWKCDNWNKFLHQPSQQFPFQNLTNISLKSCHKIKYLFSPLMAIHLPNLKSIIILKCDGIEEVVSSRDDKNEEITTSTSSHHTTKFFPHLNTLMFCSLPCLKSIDSGDTRSNNIREKLQIGQLIDSCWSLCQYPRNIHINGCVALSSLVPWYAAGKMKKLEELEIVSCKMMVEVFESEWVNSSNNNVNEGSAQYGPSTNVVVPQLSHLTRVAIGGCDLLTHIFTFSTLESLKQLKELDVNRCNAIQVIVKEEDTGMSSKVAVFPRLRTLKLHDLPNLKGFFLGMNEFQWPLLEEVNIKDCPQMMMFTNGQSKTPNLRYIWSQQCKYSLESDLNIRGGMISQITVPTSSYSTISKEMSWSSVIEVVIEMAISGEVGGTSIIPSNAMLQLQKLEKINLAVCVGVEELFEVALDGSSSSEVQTVVQIPNLREVHLNYLFDLKCLWKRNQWMILEFPKLTTLQIGECYKLEHVFTRSMVSSLVQLQHLDISKCIHVEVIVKEDGEQECDGKVNEVIMLPRLKSLTLRYLSELKGFCLGNEAFSLPVLDSLEISECPTIREFTTGPLSAPELKAIDSISDKKSTKYYIRGDLNSFIKTKQEEGQTF